MKTIAIFCGYALPHLGGIERYVDNLSKQLVKLNYKVIVVSSNYDKVKTVEHKNSVLYIRIPVYRLFKDRYPLINHFNKEYRVAVKELNKYKIDRIIVNTRFHLTTLFGAKYGKKNNIPVYLIEHGSNHLSVSNRVLDWFGAIYEHFLTRMVKKYTDYFYGVSEDACNWLNHFKIKSNGVWYNSINRFDEDILIRKSDKTVRVLYAGRVIKEKGIEDLIAAFNKLNNKNIELTIAGEGNYLDYLKNKYANNQIKFLGKMNFDDLLKVYAKTNIFVHPSHYPEGLPTCILEAGLMKCAVIATPNGGTRYFINGNNGIIVNSQEELEKALKELVSNKELTKQMGEKLHKTIVENFTWEVTAKKILSSMDV